jgi:hypothetical protein
VAAETHILRPNRAMAEVVDALLRLADQVGIRRAARAMEVAGVPVRVIARVLCDTDQRRPAVQVVVH